MKIKKSKTSRIKKLKQVANGVLWLGNNLHNIKEDPERFTDFFKCLIKDAKDALKP